MEATFLRRAAIVAVAVVLLWRIIAVNAVLYDETGRPRFPDFASRADVAAQLSRNPAEARLLLLLAQLDARSNDGERLRTDVAAAAAIAPVDPSVLETEAGVLLSQRRYDEAAVRLSRIASLFGSYDRLFPLFARMLAAQEPALMRVAAQNPPWLGAFILDQCRKGSDPRRLVALLQDRATSTSWPEPAEVDCVTDRLRVAGHWNEAYLAWLNSLPKERLSDVGSIFNGSFEHPPSGVGFDWKPDGGHDSGHAVEFVRAGEGRGQHALRVAYNGKRQFAPALLQYLAVPPGRYQLSGKARIDAINGPRGIRWVVRCASDGNATVLGASERFLGSSEWAAFAFDVEVAPGCAGQVLRLEPVGMEEGTTFLAGTAWFDDLSLTGRR